MRKTKSYKKIEGKKSAFKNILMVFIILGSLSLGVIGFSDTVNADSGLHCANGNLGAEGFTSVTVINDTAITADQQGTIYAYDTDTCSVKWTKDTSANTDDVGGFDHYGGRLIIPNGTGIMALNPETGGILWESQTQSSNDIKFISTRNGVTVGVSNSNNNMWAWNSTNGNELWANFDNQAGTNGPPVIDNGVVYQGHTDGVARALYLNNGTEKWSMTSPNGGEWYRTFTAGENAIYGATTYGVRAIEKDNGLIKWSRSPFDGDYLRGPPTYDGERVYMGYANGYIEAYEPKNGSRYWSKSTGGNAFGIAIANGQMHYNDDFGEITITNLTTPTQQYNYDLGFGRILPPLTVDNGKAYVVNESGYFAVVDLPHEKTQNGSRALENTYGDVIQQSSSTTQIPPGNLSVRHSGCLEPNEHVEYHLYLTNESGKYQVEPNSVTIDNSTVLDSDLINNSFYTLVEGESNITYNYGDYSLTEKVKVYNNSIENLHKRDGICKVVAFTGDEIGGHNANIQWLSLAILFGVTLSYGFKNKWIGIISIQIMIVIGWFMGFVSSAIMLASLFYAIFISLAMVSAFKQRVNINMGQN